MSIIINESSTSETFEKENKGKIEEKKMKKRKKINK